jgi:DNA-binding HxlR family transcriptional regulator
MIIREALFGHRRFEQFRDELEIADNVLSRRLAQMVDDGLLAKQPYHDGQRTRSEYVLTEAGADLLPILNALASWGNQHTAAPARVTDLRVQHRGCGGWTDSADVCTACGEYLESHEVAWYTPWTKPATRPMVGAAGDRSAG